MTTDSGNCTLAARHRVGSEVNRSRFVAIAEPLDDIDRWEPALAALRDPSASHNCWAWRWGQHYRSSDDGEPAGSAGRPILAAIDGQGFDRVLVVVQRWFGGIKLGVGGLVRAYGGCAAECLRTASRRPLLVLAALRIDCDFAHTDLLHRMISQHAAVLRSVQYGSRGATLRIEIVEDSTAAFRAAVADATRGQARVESEQA